ncbi:MAG: S41 family peptidase [Lachnospiraceae bacterium]|nr:S41 family peptidase [Lachnospiraceae bacterium]
MLKKVLIGIIIALTVIGLIIGGTYVVYQGMSKGIADIRSGGMFSKGDGNNTVTPGQNGNNNSGNNGGNGVNGSNGANSQNGSATPTQGASGNLFGDHGSDEADSSMTDEEKREFFNSKLDTIMKYIDTYFYDEIDDNVIYDAMLHAALNSLGDPYSTYYSPKEFDMLLESSSGTYSGIGATVSQNIETGKVKIVKPFIDSPAMKAGVLPDDEIIKVEGISVEGMDLNEVVSYLKGPEGTDVHVTFLREEKEIDLTITRAKIVVQFVTSKMLEDDIGYIMVSEFEETTDEQFDQAIDDLMKQGMKGLIVDLRDNPGGLVDTVVNMLDRIAPKGSLLVYTEDKYGTRDSEYALSDSVLEVPLVVLVNGNSASASEIFAGAVQDLGLGKIVGTQTFGKGIVQSVIPIMQDISGIKVTSSKYFTPKGVCIHGVGITPDKVVELDEELLKTLIEMRERDNQIDAARELVKSME